MIFIITGIIINTNIARFIIFYENLIIKTLINIIANKSDLGLPFDVSINSEFEKKLKHNNFIFQNGIDLIHEFFNIERKSKNKILSKSVQLLGKNPFINKLFTKVADKGLLL